MFIRRIDVIIRSHYPSLKINRTNVQSQPRISNLIHSKKSLNLGLKRDFSEKASLVKRDVNDLAQTEESTKLPSSQFSPDPDIEDFGNELYEHLTTMNLNKFLVHKEPVITEDISLLAAIKPVDRNRLNAAILQLSKSGNLEKLKQSMEIIKGNGVKPDIVMYTSYLKGFAAAGKYHEAESIIDEIKKDGLELDRWLYGTLILAYVNGKQIEKAFDIAQQMLNQGMLLNQVIGTTLIKGFIKKRNFSRAFKLYDELKERKIIIPDVTTYTTLIGAFAKLDNVEKALKLYEEMLKNDIKPTEVTYNSLLYACARRRDYYEETFKIYDTMISEGYKPDMITIGTLLHSCANVGDVKKAESIYKQIDQPNEIIYSSLMTTYANACKSSRGKDAEYNIIKADELLDKIDKIMKPNDHIITSYLSVYTKALRIRRAEDVFNKIFDKYGLKKSLLSYTSMLQMYAQSRNADKAFEIRKMMIDDGIKFDYPVYVYLMKAAARAERPKAGFQILQDMIANGMIPKKADVYPLYAVTNMFYPTVALRIKELCKWGDPDSKIPEKVLSKKKERQEKYEYNLRKVKRENSIARKQKAKERKDTPRPYK